MSDARLLLIGANSDLVQPLLNLAGESSVQVMPLTREDWDLTDCFPADYVMEKILNFRPNHLLFSAGMNVPQYLGQDPVSAVRQIQEHFVVNCLSLLSVVLNINSRLPSSLKTIHAISSLYGIYGRRTRMPYSVSKHALEGAVKCLAAELPDTLVLAYRPGFFSTKLTSKNLTKEMQDSLIARIPAGRLGQAEELSSVILQNILKPPIYASGSAITLDGGLTAGGIFEI